MAKANNCGHHFRHVRVHRGMDILAEGHQALRAHPGAVWQNGETGHQREEVFPHVGRKLRIHPF